MEIHTHLQSQLKDNQAIRVIILLDKTDLKEFKISYYQNFKGA